MQEGSSNSSLLCQPAAGLPWVSEPHSPLGTEGLHGVDTTAMGISSPFLASARVTQAGDPNFLLLL